MSKIQFLFLVFVFFSSKTDAQGDNYFSESFPLSSIEIEEKGNPNTLLITGIHLLMDNDFLNPIIAIWNDDTEYTGGLKIELLGDIPRLNFNKLTKGSLPLHDLYNSIYFRGKAFTPQISYFGETDPVKFARPYSSFVGLGKSRLMQLSDKEIFIETDFLIGKMGMEFMGNLQNWLHENITDKAEVKGWHNQIAGGGRWAYNYMISMNYLILNSNRFHLNLRPHINLGNLERNQGLLISVGNLNFNPIKYLNQLKVESKTKLALIGSFQIIHNTHNSYLSGLPRSDNSIHKLPYSKLKKFIPKYEFRISVDNIFRKSEATLCGLYLKFTYIGQEHEYRIHHIYGTVGFKLTWLSS